MRPQRTAGAGEAFQPRRHAATFATASGVTHIASQQFAMAEKAAMSQTGDQVASVQHVVVVARRLA